MALPKQSIPINFSQALDLKTDPYQVGAGKFLALQNTIFDKGGQLQKRNGFGNLTALPLPASSVSTFSGGLVALGNQLQAYSADTMVWSNQGPFTPIALSTQVAMRASSNQVACDAAVASNGLACAVFIDSVSGPQYQILDSNTGQIVVRAKNLPATATSPRVFSLPNFFMVTFVATVSSAAHLQYIAIPINNPTSPRTAADISTQVSALTAGYDAFVANSTLYVAWNGSDGGGAIRLSYIDGSLVQHNTVVLAGATGTRISVTADASGSALVVWLSYWDGTTLHATSYSSTLVVTQAPTTLATTSILYNVTSAATGGVLTCVYDTTGVLGYAVQTYQNGAYGTNNAVPNYNVNLVTLTGTTVATPISPLLGVSLASKAFLASGIVYYLIAYESTYQNSYFLANAGGQVISRLAYENGGGYPTTQVLSNATISDTTATICYLYKDFISTLSTQSTQAPDGGIYTQTGVNLGSFDIGTTSIQTSELGSGLHITGGLLWQYDGVYPVEHGFNLFPDNLGATTATTGGNLAAQTYFYQAVYEWTDAQGMIHRSTPSIPLEVVTTGSTSTNTIYIPYLRLTSKGANNPVRITLYRYSTQNQIYYQITSIISPVSNTTAQQYYTYTDTVADANIIGSNLIYTSGGVVEDIGAPGANAVTIFDTRLWLIDAEDPNTLWFSKQVIEGTPVEFSDLLTVYISPSISAQGSTGPCTALAPLDDKLIIFKKDAIYYINGTGPDITGANNQYSQPIFITGTVGCADPQSIVLTPTGLMFQSDKGIWMLGRDMSTSYIGAPVETYNSYNVVSALTIPGTNQVRFSLDNGITLLYDYYFNLWGTFAGVPATSATLFQGLHTFINASGQVLQETPNLYVDGSSPVLMSFTTGWINLAGLQGFERAYFFYLLGEYQTPHKLSIGIAYDYNPSPQQVSIIQPDNYSAPWGADPLWGDNQAWGGSSNVEQWRIFLAKQKCQAFQITMTEIFDPSYGVAPGGGLTVSGLNLVVGAKKGYTTIRSSRSVG